MRYLLLLGFFAMSACSTPNVKLARDVSHLENSEVELEENKIGGEIPHEINDNVLKWVNYFTGRGRPHMERYLSRSTRYTPLMKQILREEGLPEDLIYVALIESGFSSSAHSHANAVGYWQFIRGTGKAYGLEINPVIDERRDFVLATRAAAQYFKSLHMLFDDWYLAIAAYNVGENRVKRLVMKYRTRDFWELARRKKLPRETINYVPKYLAARMIGKNPAKYGFDSLDFHAPLNFEEIKASYPINLKDLAVKSNIEWDEMKALNPRYRTEYAPVKKSGELMIRVPVGFSQKANEMLLLSKVDDEKKIQRMMASNFVSYKVRRGDTLGAIARRHRTRVSEIRKLNRLNSRSMIRVGQRLQIPSHLGSYKGGSSSNRSLASNPKYVRSSRSSTHHRVRSGETLSHIARKYRVGLSQLLSSNSLSLKSKIVVGQKLVIPGTVKKEQASVRRIARKIVHIVRRGDTLTGLASKYSIPIRTIAKHNGLSDRDDIQIGNKLLIPEM